MSRKKKHRRTSPRQAAAQAAPPSMLGGSIQATEYNPNAGLLYWPTLDGRYEISTWDLDSLYRSARNLEANTGIIGKAIEDIVSFQGWILPQPRTRDEEWNRLARAAFLARTGQALTFDISGQLNWKTMQRWMETRRTVDGDCLCVLAEAPDGGAALRFYTAPQIQSPAEGQEGWIQGVRCSPQGRPIAYGLMDYETGAHITIPAASAIHYRHNPDPLVRRGITDLKRAIMHARDIAEIYGYTKASVKLAASIGLVETKSEGDKNTGAAAAIGRKHAAAASPGQPEQPPVQIVPGGATLVSLDPGRDVKILQDTRPSPNTVEFIRQLVAEIAYGVGLEPGILYALLGMGSAEVRFFNQKLKRWIESRLLYRTSWANRVYQYTLAREIAAGRLRPCLDPAWYNVDWIPMRDITIDIGRDGNLAISLIREGLASVDSWTLATEGKTGEQIIDERIHLIAHAKQKAAAAGITWQELLPGMPGAAAPTAGTTAVTPQPVEDDEPEAPLPHRS